MVHIQQGAHGEAVRDIQHRLLGVGMRIDTDELDGSFGSSTESAVRTCQRDRGLPQDGIVGPDTWSQLVEAGYRLGDRTLYLRAPAFRGDDVRELQRMLNVLGFDAGKEDGIFGPRTNGGVREFQRNVAARVDGIVGLDTVHAITRYRPPVEGASRAVVREGEAARGPGLMLAGAIIAIDPDPGVGVEPSTSVAVAAALVAQLERVGARPLLLWEGPQPPAIDERVRRANAGGAAVLISIGLGSGEQLASGTTTLHYGTPSTHSPMGRRLAESIHVLIVSALRLEDGGVQSRSIAILRETRMPAVRVEPAVASSDRDAEAIAGPSFADDVARAIVDGIIAFSRPASADLARSS